MHRSSHLLCVYQMQNPNQTKVSRQHSIPSIFIFNCGFKNQPEVNSPRLVTAGQQRLPPKSCIQNIPLLWRLPRYNIVSLTNGKSAACFRADSTFWLQKQFPCQLLTVQYVASTNQLVYKCIVSDSDSDRSNYIRGGMKFDTTGQLIQANL